MTYKIIQNAIQTPDGTIIKSKSRHNYVAYIDKNKRKYFVDGGVDYIRHSIFPNDDMKELFVFENTPFEEAREKLVWGTYGPNGDQPFSYVKIKEMSTNHIENIIKDFKDGLDNFYLDVFKIELKKRKRKRNKS